MKNLLAAFAFICFALPSFGQFSVGLSGGPSISFTQWHIKSPALDGSYDPALGYRAVVQSEWQISRLLALRAEVGGQVKRDKLELKDDLGEFTGHLYQHFQYWEGSLLLQVSPIKAYRHLYLLAGCTAGKLTNAWERTTGIRSSPGKRAINLDQSFYNRNALAVDFGLGGNVPLDARSSIKLEGRYQFGLLDFSTNNNVDARLDPLMLSVGYLYQL